ncbi:MAG: hypothetical protein OK456_00725 [Thaumarchaeota archaeon]|nr:hypothetical protein [Nitrososphaerota archaeon]
MSLMVSDNAPTAFCKVEISSYKMEGRQTKLYLEAIIVMDIQEEAGFSLKDFAVDRTMKEVRSYFPEITVGRRYKIQYSEVSGPETVTKEVVSVAMRPISVEFSFKKFEGYDLTRSEKGLRMESL